MKIVSLILFVLAINTISANIVSASDLKRRLGLDRKCHRSLLKNTTCDYYSKCVKSAFNKCNSFSQGKDLCNELTKLKKNSVFKGAGVSWANNAIRCIKHFTHQDVARKGRGNGHAWRRIGGRLINVTSGNDGRVWGTNAANAIYTRMGVNGRWVRIGGALKQISVDTNGRVWGVNRANQIFTRPGVRGPWKYIGGLRMKQIAVGHGGMKGKTQRIWGVTPKDRIYTRLGVNGKWKAIGGGLKWIAVARNGRVWGVNSGNNIYTRKGVKGGWKWIPGKLTNIAVANNGRVWGTNRYHQIWTRRGVKGRWIKVSGRLKQVSIGKDGRVWGVCPYQRIWTSTASADDCKSMKSRALNTHHVCMGTTGLCRVLKDNKKARKVIESGMGKWGKKHKRMVGTLKRMLKKCK